MKFKLMTLMSGTVVALAGCTTDHSQVGYQQPQAPLYGNPAPRSEQSYDYTPRQEAHPEPVPQYSQQAPQYDAQPPQNPGPDYARQDDDVPNVNNTQDFERPLAEHGRWLETPEYGRVWQPYNQPSDWRPYSSDGRWVYTSYGWTWSSYQPWGWACYHYGNWVFQPRCGWVWVPGTVWAPAWVVWRECDDYVAWAPAPVAHGPRFFASIEYCDGVRYFDFVVVERRNFCRPIAPAIVIAPVHNVKIVNKTVNITKIKIVNKVAVNQGPQVTKIENVTHEKVRVEKVRDVVKAPAQFVNRHHEERENGNRINTRSAKPEKQQVRTTSPASVVSVPRVDESPAPARKEETKPDKQDRQYRNNVSRDEVSAAERKPTQQPDPNRSTPRETRYEKRPTPSNQPTPEMRSVPTRTDSATVNKSDRKTEKQIQREQQRQPAATYTPYAPRPTNNMPAVPSERPQKFEKKSRKELARTREANPPADQYAAPDQKNTDGTDRKHGKRDSQNQPQY